jgi:glutathione synthase/RimK-type ligase-like ATP-grasp enzyme
MKKRKTVIGIIYSGKGLGKDEKAFLKVAKKKNIELVIVNMNEKFSETELRNIFKDCCVIYCNSAEDYAIEFIKTLEEFGKKVIDTSKSHYYIQDKWFLYLECEKKKIPVPKTILLSEDLNVIRGQLSELNLWPIILKKLNGTMGECIERAEDTDEAIEIIKRFWGEGEERFPLIAQEYVHSDSYRVTLVNGKILQTAVKSGTGWKLTGVYAKKIKKFRVDSDLSKMVKKIIEFVDIKVCGLDFVKKGNKWLLLEVNSEPAFDFFSNEREMIVEKVLDYLIRLDNKAR